jgi:hypothetical protein
MDLAFNYEWTMFIVGMVKISSVIKPGKIFWASHLSTIVSWGGEINPKPCITGQNLEPCSASSFFIEVYHRRN